MVNYKRRVIAKIVAYAISLVRDAAGTVFTNRDAIASVTFTLPTPAFQYLGVPYSFRCVVAQNLVVAGNAAGDLLTLNDVAANSIALQTGGQLIGGTIEAECIETTSGVYKWQVYGTAVGHTYTVTT